MKKIIFLLFLLVTLLYADAQSSRQITGKILDKETGIGLPDVSVIERGDVVQSDRLVFDNITYKDGSELLFRISGDRSNNINVKNTDASKAKEKIVYELGATEKSVKIK